MAKKLNNKEIVGEAMYSVRSSLNANIPLPPMNADGSFKSLNQMVGEGRLKEWKAQKANEALIAEMDRRSANDPEQIQWEKEQGLRRRRVVRDEYEFVIPDGVKVIFYIVLFIAVVIGLIYTG